MGRCGQMNTTFTAGLKQARADEREAARFVAPYLDKIVPALAAKRLPNHGDGPIRASDIYIAAHARAAKSLANSTKLDFPDESQFGKWVAVIVFNAMRDELRRPCRETELSPQAASSSDTERNETASSVRDLLPQVLEPDELRLLELYLEHCLEPKWDHRAGDLLHMTPGAVRAWFYRICDKLERHSSFQALL
jgi:DNA-directed RNA polymerase specialized sigma24 family protein